MKVSLASDPAGKHVGIIAEATDQRVVAAAPLQGVGAVPAGQRVGVIIADDLIGQFIAGPGNRGQSGQRQVLDERA